MLLAADWKVVEAFSNASGTVQFIELSDSVNNDEVLQGNFIGSNELHSIFQNNLPSASTANQHLLIGTVDYAKQAGAVTPDLTVPDNFFSISGDRLAFGTFTDPDDSNSTDDSDGSSDQFDYSNSDSLMFTSGQLPTDGTNALFRNLSTNALSTGTNSETNFAGQTGSLGGHVNRPPTIAPVANLSLGTNAGEQTVDLSGITAGAGQSETISITASSNNTAVIPNPTVNYTSPNSTGTLTFTPVASATGTATITLTVTNSGGTATTESFQVTVNTSNSDLQKFITKVYNDLLGRAPDAGGLSFWTTQLADGVPRSQIAQDLTHTPEYFSTIIKPAYETYLGRAADSAGLSFWTTQMQDGLTDEQLEAAFIGSDEFFQHAGGTNKGWVDAMYQNLLGRQPDPQGEAFWVQQLNNGASRSSVALGFATSTEREGQLVTGDYEHFLGRAPDQAGLTFWVNQFAMGVTNEDLIAGFIASDEYFNNAISA